MSKPKPNVVFVITDDQGYGDLGCAGNPIIRTPHIDRLHAESVRFTDFHVGPTCAPTRAGLMTGHYHNSTGVWHTIGGRSLLRKDEISLADVFSANGYRTGIFGKWHLGDNYPYRPHDRGFQEAVVHGGGGIGNTPDYWGNDYFDDTYFDRGSPRRFEGYCTDVWFRLGLDFIERHRDEPFFCYIPTNAPHSPFQVEERYVEPYRGQVPENRARFYGMITNIDENVGGLRRRLEELGLADNTIFVFMTDNGTATGCEVDEEKFVMNGYNFGMRGKKNTPYEGGHRVPFFLHWPAGGYSVGKDVSELTANVDFLPTLAELCGLELPAALQPDGVCVVPLMLSGEPKWEERAVVTDSQRIPQPIKWRMSAVMRGKWRLINGKELYRVDADPEQRDDLAAIYPQMVELLRSDYDMWWDKVSAKFDEDIPIHIGSPREPVTLLSPHDWRGDVGECAWHQTHIRGAKVCNSYLELFVEQSGRYAFELRRWPREEDRAFAEGIPGELGPYSGGVAVPVTKAAIRIRSEYAEAHIAGDERQITFELELEEGPAHLQTYMEAGDGTVRGVYYVYVRKL
ncbi:arylsulfatase [Paenibacillus koleovorans]|uniref:arylsulfatase n=1 Tax=Paenibacillus koleovorans TaxID=121608 RepID=UPI000FDB3969|nr:arylsulfatase [Paenibacillus koleovorans]